MKEKKWNVVKLTNTALGIEVDGESMFQHGFEVIEKCGTDAHQAYERMKVIAKEKGMYAFRYSTLEKTE